ncbi:MAG: YggS family pyridoxal phosphate-dependent enzyme, partial [Chloroflexi bacterium]|nr:YggS family pyridoxal phosphate-dependent enzyme [Chloroflexota bacterium]
ARAARDPAHITLIAISKTQPPEVIAQAAAVGLQHFGENRVEEADVKIPLLRAQVTTPLRWHMVGHIQSRKAKLVPPLFDVVHSVDNLKLADKLAAAAQAHGQTRDVLLQMNVSGEESKSGFEASRWRQDTALFENLAQQCAHIARMPGLNVRGLMTMAPIVADMQQARPVFASLAALRAALSAALKLPLPDLSMGMTDDYPVAIEEGATLLRIGRALFGERH